MKLAILISMLALQPTAHAPTQPARTLQPPVASHIPNGLATGANCLPIIQQVQDRARANRDDEHRTLDRDPPAHLILAVDRQVNGCREVTFIRRDAGPSERAFPQPSR